MTGEEEGIINFHIQIPEGVDVVIEGEGRKVKVIGPRGEIERELWHPGLQIGIDKSMNEVVTVSYTHLRAHETSLHLVCRLLLSVMEIPYPAQCLLDIQLQLAINTRSRRFLLLSLIHI